MNPQVLEVMTVNKQTNNSERTMSPAQRRPFRRRLQARFMAVVNVPMRVVLGLPFSTPLGNRLMLLTLRGRKTGRIYKQSVSYVRDGTTLLTPGGGKWKLNLRPDEAVSIRLQGRDLLAQPELVRDSEEVEGLLGKMMVGNPSVAAFVGVSKGADGRFERGQLETALRYGFCIVRWHLEESLASGGEGGVGLGS
jgi:F420H(2)-dependent quinone reductase